jgi:hypothetical protein
MRRLVRAQILEHGAQAVATTNFLRRDGVTAVHVNQELGIRREKGHLALNVPAICAVSVRVDKLANGRAIANFPQGETAMVRSLHRKGHRLLLGCALAGRHDVE